MILNNLFYQNFCELKVKQEMKPSVFKNNQILAADVNINLERVNTLVPSKHPVSDKSFTPSTRVIPTCAPGLPWRETL